MDTLKYLKNEDLRQKTKTLVEREREILVEILNHLKEIDRRRLYLEWGYSSLWAYMTTELKYSEAAAQRRIEALRAIRELPLIENKIASGALSVSNVAKAQSVLKRVKKNAGAISEIEKVRLFQRLEHKSQREADLLLASQFPEEVKIQESIRPISEEKSELRLSISNDLVKKLERVRDLISHQKPNASMAEVIELMADLLIQKKDLAERRPEKRSVKGSGKASGKGQELERGYKAASVNVSEEGDQPPPRRLHRPAVPAQTRREVSMG